ncbi:unnamed protein product [Periconia digitata]|uniref:Protein kinase domain-containing protein n=1 Tax=Periconia digitata TaxID=1303443 RepID=A0A9W4URE4_9PLEO|nr:unnamed protein product [Periconia digitata]
MKQFTTADPGAHQQWVTHPRGERPEILHHWMSSDQTEPIIRFRGAAICSSESSPLLHHRIFLEFAEGGSLWSLMEARRALKRPIPEDFVWIVLMNLVEACIRMEEVGVVHLDINPHNVLLSTNHDRQGGHWLDVYRPVLADFGKTHPFGEALGPHDTGKLGFTSPEQFEAAIGISNKSNDKVHVYGIGFTIWCMIRNLGSGLEQSLDSNPPRAVFISPQGTNINPAPPAFSPDPRITVRNDVDLNSSKYSEGLEYLIQQCLIYDPAQRITLEQLGERVGTRIFERGMDQSARPADEFALMDTFDEMFVNADDAIEA